MEIQEYNIKSHLLGFAEYITQNHPEMIYAEGKANIEDFCKNAVSDMTEHFVALLKDGIAPDAAFEIANKELYAGLLFSKYNFIKEIIQRIHPVEYANMEKTDTLHLQIFEIIANTKHIFERFDTEDLSLDLSKKQS